MSDVKTIESEKSYIITVIIIITYFNYHFDVSDFSEASADSEDCGRGQRGGNRHKGSDPGTGGSHVFPILQCRHGFPFR